MAKQELSAPFIGIVRHRLATDGKGVTTLAAFHGCPLRCKYCLNPQCLDPKMVWRNITTSQLLDELLLDNMRWLLEHDGMRERVIVRLPHIPGHNTQDDINHSRALLEQMGVTRFDEFDYIVKQK